MDELSKAMKLLRENGYLIIRYSKQMQKDAEECMKMMDNGEQKECWGCSCSKCVTNIG